MFYYIPIFPFILQQSINFQHQQLRLTEQKNNQHLSITQHEEKLHQLIKDNWNSYLNLFRQQLSKNIEKQKKKIWSTQQDQILIKLKQNKSNWKDISKLISETNSQICKRRYYRLMETNMRWPKQVDLQIKYLCEIQEQKWTEIAKYLNEKFKNQITYSAKMVKQRYQFYLKKGIQIRQWSIDEDIKLIQSINAKGKFWKKLLKQFPGRTQLQLKNRYNGTLKFIQNRVVSYFKNFFNNT